jgi:hypothetical protein
MRGNEEGSIEFGAAIILAFLAALLAGSVLLASTNLIYFKRNSNEQNEKFEMDILLSEMVASLQPLKEYEYDDYRNPLLQNLRAKYSRYNLDFEDISSGYHVDFLPDSDLQDQRLSEYLFLNNSASGFIAFRNIYGLSDDKAIWKPYIKEEVWDSCVSYGWIHQSQLDSFAFKTAASSYSMTAAESLFPLVNDFPLMNVNMVKPEALIPLITRPFFKIEKPAEKAETFKNKLLQGPVTASDISSFLEIPSGHALFNYLGTKTAFWKLRLKYKPDMYAEAIVACIPKKNGVFQEIAEYKLIDRTISYDYRYNN